MDRHPDPDEGMSAVSSGQAAAETLTTPRVAVVTGAARGIGAAVARALAAEGRHVALLDLDRDAAEAVAADIRQSGGTALALRVDVADEESVDTGIAAVVDELGPPTIAVSNAGILRDSLIHKMSVADWDAVAGVHLRGTFLLTRAVQRHMVAEGWGRLVVMSSTSALGNRGQANYAAAKAGLQGFAKTMAIELGRYGVTANAIAPGFIETEMTHATANRLGISFEEFAAQITPHIPLGRAGRPEDVAAVATFLAGETAAYVSGQVIYVAGGPRD